MKNRVKRLLDVFVWFPSSVDTADGDRRCPEHVWSPSTPIGQRSASQGDLGGGSDSNQSPCTGRIQNSTIAW